MTDVSEKILAKMAVFAPQVLELRDESAAHAGHAGAKQGGHFALTIVSEQFAGLSRLARHRAIMERVADLMPSPVHALRVVKAAAPNEI